MDLRQLVYDHFVTKIGCQQLGEKTREKIDESAVRLQEDRIRHVSLLLGLEAESKGDYKVDYSVTRDVKLGMHVCPMQEIILT